MTRQIFINLPVRDLKQSIRFFDHLGFSFNSDLTDDTATCMVVDTNIFVMLLTHERFKTFTPNAICDTTKNTEVLLCLSCGSRQEVDDMVARAVAAQGRTYNQPQDHGYMYGHGFQDLDGHIWEVVYMDLNYGQE